MTTDSKQKRIIKDGEITLEKMITNCECSKYDLVIMASLWARHLKKSEEFRNATTAEIIDNSIRQVLSGKVSWKDIEKHAAAEQEKKKPGGKKSSS